MWHSPDLRLFRSFLQFLSCLYRCGIKDDISPYQSPCGYDRRRYQVGVIPKYIDQLYTSRACERFPYPFVIEPDRYLLSLYIIGYRRRRGGVQVTQTRSTTFLAQLGYSINLPTTQAQLFVVLVPQFSNLAYRPRLSFSTTYLSSSDSYRQSYAVRSAVQRRYYIQGYSSLNFNSNAAYIPSPTLYFRLSIYLRLIKRSRGLLLTTSLLFAIFVAFLRVASRLSLPLSPLLLLLLPSLAVRQPTPYQALSLGILYILRAYLRLYAYSLVSIRLIFNLLINVLV